MIMVISGALLPRQKRKLKKRDRNKHKNSKLTSPYGLFLFIKISNKLGTVKKY